MGMNNIAANSSNQIKSYTVYKHTCPNGKVYIGITGMDVPKRWGKDGKKYKTCSYFWSAIRKYGWGNIAHEVLYYGITETEAKRKEKELIKKYNSKNPKYGYNLTDGGDGICGWRHSDQAKIKISLASKGNRNALGYKHSEKAKAIMSAKQLGNHKALGFKHSETSRKINSDSKKGIRKTEETKQKLRDAQNKLTPDVEQFTLNGGFIGCYSSCVDAYKMTGVYRAGIQAVCSGRQRTAGGFVWRYVN